MALIICPDCGKRFSDQAPACPECGYPTSKIISSNDTTPSESLLKSSKNATDVMKTEVSSAKMTADEASRLFDKRNDDIQIKAKRTIDLFGGKATSQTVELAHDAKKACDNLYSTYQMLVAHLDSKLRPLLNDNPEPSAVLEVWKYITYLNNESEIKANFTMTFNAQNLGDVATAQYMPSISNKIIEEFWELQANESFDKYDSIRKLMPEVTTTESVEEAILMESAENSPEAIHQEFEESETELNPQEKQMKKLDEEIETYEREIDSWKEAYEKISDENNESISEEAAEFVARLQSIARIKYDADLKECNNQLSVQENVKASAMKVLSSLGVFELSAKKEQKDIIKGAEQEINKIKRNLENAESELKQALDNAKVEADAFSSEVRTRIEKNNPLPEKPQLAPKAAIYRYLKRRTLATISEFIRIIPELNQMDFQQISPLIEELEKDGILQRNDIDQKVYYSITGTTIYGSAKNAKYIEAIVEFLSDGKSQTISEMQENVPILNELEIQQVSALLRSLYNDGLLERVELSRKAYFFLRRD